jgi:hypothetical protein
MKADPSVVESIHALVAIRQRLIEDIEHRMNQTIQRGGEDSPFGAVANQRVAYRGLDPARLRQRMIDPDVEKEEIDEENKEETHAAIFKALEKMSDSDRWAVLQNCVPTSYDAYRHQVDCIIPSGRPIRRIYGWMSTFRNTRSTVDLSLLRRGFLCSIIITRLQF